MSIALTAWVWSSTIKDPTQVSVLAYLANYADDRGGNCFPGIPLLARLARRSERTVTRTLLDLEFDGWIEIQRGSGRGNLTQFQLNCEQLKRCQDVTLSVGGKKVTSVLKRVTPATGKGDTSDNPPHPLFGVSVKEPSRNQVHTPQPPQAGELELVKTDHVGFAVDQVMQGCGFTARRLKSALRAVIELEVDKGSPAPTAALAMIAAWKSYILQDASLRVKWGARRFFEEGYWRDPRSWHWDGQKLREDRLRMEARVGS